MGAGFASPILRRLGGGIPAFCSNVNEEANLGAFLCTLHYSEGRNSRDFFFRGFGRVSALRGRAGADCDCASFQFWQNGSAFCIVVGFGGAGFRFFLSCW